MIAQLLPFATVGLLACASIALTLRNALPAIRQLRLDLAQCPNSRELRFTVRELRYVSRVNVVKLPLRQRRALGADGRRAAA